MLCYIAYSRNFMSAAVGVISLHLSKYVRTCPVEELEICFYLFVFM